MRIAFLIIAASVFACLTLPAWSLEASSSIKVTPLLKTQTSWDGKPIEYPKGRAEITGMLVEIAPGGETGWHLHPVPSFGMVLEGTLELTLKTGEHKIIKAGEALAEVVNTLHNGHNIGTTPVKILVFYAGSTELKTTEKAALETGKPTAAQQDSTNKVHAAGY